MSEIDRDELLAAIEDCSFLLPEVAGRIEHLQIPGVRGRACDVAHSVVNLVGAARLNGANVERTLDRVWTLYRERNVGFDWVVTPLSTPADLARRLVDRGATRLGSGAGMVLTDLSVEIPCAPGVHVREATRDDVEAASVTMSLGFGVPREVCRLLNEVLLHRFDRADAQVFLAYVDDCPDPVGYGNLVRIPGRPIVVLSGASTEDPYRGRGVYRALVAARIRATRNTEAGAVVLQAMRQTSAPHLSRMGFVEVCDVSRFSWPAERWSERRV